ncbi:PepSY domain-containing protein [Shewanella maritima]|uniref:PepSY domain-containing protein n=1 Tax=Shewanella maritima TaxID=2520507 RepID=UPI0037365B30
MTIAIPIKSAILCLLLMTPVCHVQAQYTKMMGSERQPSYQVPGLQSEFTPNPNKKPKKQSLKINSSQQAIARVQQQYQGKVLRVQASGSGSSYQVKMLSNDGRVFYVTVDARTGSVRRN